MSSASNQELENLKNIYSSNGKDKNSWINFHKDINNDSFISKIISFLQANMKENPKNELTLDIIDFAIDFGNQYIINLISQKQFLDSFIKLLKSETKAGIENQKKVIYLTQKWAKKFYENKNLSIFFDNYNYLKKNGIVFPPLNFVLNTYDKYITKNDIMNQEQNEKNNNNDFHQNQNNNYNSNEVNNDTDNLKSNNNYNNNYNNNNYNNNNYNNNNYNNNNYNNNNYNNNNYNNNNNNTYNNNNYNNNYQMNNNRNDDFPMGNNDGFPGNNNNNYNSYNNSNNDNNPYDDNNPYNDNNNPYNNDNNNSYNPYEEKPNNPFSNFNNSNNNFPYNNNYSSYNTESMMLVESWKSKIKTINKYIDEGKFSYHSTKAKEGIKDILNNIDLIDDKIKQSMERGDEQGRNGTNML